jgi:branched-chain amino acid transport system permease protein
VSDAPLLRAALWGAAGVAGIVLVLAPAFVGSYYQYVASLILINILIASGLNLLTGAAGQISLCNSSFMAIGAYASVYLTNQVGLPYWLSLPSAGLIAAGFGLILGVPALRVRGFYLAVVTLAFLEITQIIIEETPSVTGGVRGVLAPRPSLFGYGFTTDLSFYYVVLITTCVGVYFAWSLLNSPTGRAFNAVRVNEAVAQTMAIPVVSIKLQAFALSAFYAGIGGGLFAPLVGFIDPLEFGVWTSIYHIVFIVVGGLGTVAGPIIGAAVLTALPEFLRGFQEYRELIYGALLLICLMGMPQGIAGVLAGVRGHVAPPAVGDKPRQAAGAGS